MYADCARDTLEQICDALTTLRGEEWLSPHVIGLDDFTGVNVAECVQETTAFLATPGIENLPTVKKAALREMIYKCYPNLNASDRASVEKELLSTPTPTDNSLTAISKHFENITGAQI